MMGHRFRVGLIAAMCGLFGAAGCDGDDGTGGSGGTQGPGGGGMGGAGGGGGGGGGPDYTPQCTATCETAVQNGCTTTLEECVADCLAVYAMSTWCEAEIQAYLDCAASAPQCDTMACQDVYIAWGACINDECTGMNCSGSDSCHCYGECHGEMVSVDCSADGACTCTVNGMQVGTCQDPGPSCELPGNCCTQFL